MPPSISQALGRCREGSRRADPCGRSHTCLRAGSRRGAVPLRRAGPLLWALCLLHSALECRTHVLWGLPSPVCGLQMPCRKKQVPHKMVIMKLQFSLHPTHLRCTASLVRGGGLGGHSNTHKSQVHGKA